MAAKMFIFVAFLALARAGTVPQGNATPALQDIITQLTELQRTLFTHFNATVNSETARNAQGALEQGAQTVLHQATQLSRSVEAAVNDATGRTREVLNQTSTNLQRVAQQLRREHPEVEQQSAAIGETLQGAVQTLANEASRLAQEGARNVEATQQQVAQAVQRGLHGAATRQ